MKKVILDRRKNYYKANLHSHSIKSDGKMTVEEVKEIYKQKNKHKCYMVIIYSVTVCV